MTSVHSKPISVQNLSFGYVKGDPIIQSATFDIGANEFVGIIGPNGGGKTTLLKLIMGFLDPYEGTISIFGQSPKKHPNGIAYVPQQLRCDREFPITVKELVLQGRLSKLSIFGQFSKEDHEMAIKALEKVNLLDFQKKSVGTLSGGQMQRALIARALAMNPQILLLDEPTASVDPNAEQEIYALLKTLQKELTIVMVTHDIRAVIYDVERVISVQRTIDIMSPQTLCEHFALGLYHFPLMDTKEGHLMHQKPAKTGFPVV
jgi:zinc transport system ATP-binding protein